MFANVQGPISLLGSINKSYHVARCSSKLARRRATSKAIASAVDPPPVGIDLGTTNSLVAVLQGSSPVVVPLSDGVTLLPSVVAFSDDGEVTVGAAAKRYILGCLPNTGLHFREVVSLLLSLQS